MDSCGEANSFGFSSLWFSFDPDEHISSGLFPFPTGSEKPGSKDDTHAKYDN